MALARWKHLCIDATDVESAARFWAELLGLRVVRLDDGDVHLLRAGDEQAVWVNAVPEPQTVKQRVHLDVLAPSVAAVEDLGAVRLSADGEFPWTVLADPEGGELCVFVRDEVPDYRLYELCVDCGSDHLGIATWWADVLGARLVESDRGFSYVERADGLPFEAMVLPAGAGTQAGEEPHPLGRHCRVGAPAA